MTLFDALNRTVKPGKATQVDGRAASLKGFTLWLKSKPKAQPKPALDWSGYPGVEHEITETRVDW